MERQKLACGHEEAPYNPDTEFWHKEWVAGGYRCPDCAAKMITAKMLDPTTTSVHLRVHRGPGGEPTFIENDSGGLMFPVIHVKQANRNHRDSVVFIGPDGRMWWGLVRYNSINARRKAKGRPL